ncbi:AMP-dependent synthetase and ligase [Nitzschia inconspicua]|uniref:AMP-dependent synthetase and ligase n=1 Tax=Nitzschia inconspicua TaxID=303405 RepID=A0A9K3KSS9_9STRA|nr:AMP-dependent synthetase and ligase [Nitzschia inconspicua]
MLTSKLRPISRRIGDFSTKAKVMFPKPSTTANVRFISTEREEHFKQLGILDDQGLTVFDTLHEMQVNSCKVFKDNDLFGTYEEASNSFKFMTYDEYNQKVNQCRSLLKDLGVEEYSKVAVISNNRWEWATVAAAAYSLNASLVPMYEAQLPSDWTYILNDSSSTAVFCATQDIFDKVQREVMPMTPSVKASLCFDAPMGEPHAFASAMASNDFDDSGKLIVAPAEYDLANLIYTSGTTGKPKGVELTHLNFTSNVKGAGRSMVEDPKDFVRETDRSLSFLPWAHSYGQTCELWSYMSMGASMGICRGVPVILEDLQLVKPTNLFSVPTLYKKVYDGVHNLMETAPPLRRKLMKKALLLGEARSLAERGMRKPLGSLERVQLSILDRLVLSKIRDRFGGRMRHGFSGGSACPAEVVSFMDALGIPICEGYGLTETSPIITLNVPESRVAGSVGRPLGGVTVYIVDEEGKPVAPGEEGELCCVGPNVMKGYHNNKEATDEVISVAPDGKSRMFHTGDLARMDEEGWVKITGRIKEQYKLENGKYVVPTPIENAISMSRFISQVVLCGANRPHNICLLVPEWPVVRAELKIDESVSEEELANDERVKQLIDAEISESCKGMKKFEVPKEWAFVAPFTAANNMLTPKMSIRRHKVMEAYEDLISELYGDDPIVTEAADGAHKQAA